MAQVVDAFVEVPDIIGQIEVLNGIATDAIDSAYDVANSLEKFKPINVTGSVDFQTADPNINVVNPFRPDEPDISLIDRNLPGGPDLIVPVVDINPIDIGEQPSAPTINLPTVPDPTIGDRPIKDFTLKTDFVFPDADILDLPDVPTLESLNIPTAEDIVLPIFDQVFPSSANLIPPSVVFSFTEDIYSSSLLSGIQTELLSRLSTATGINPTVEQALFDRARSREDTNSLRSNQTLTIQHAQKGWSRPAGSQLVALETAIQETQNKNADLSREIMITQANLEQSNFQSSIQQAIGLEDVLIRQHNNVQQRSFDTARFLQDTYIEIFKLEISKFNTEVQAYQAFATAYTSRVQAELVKIEIFKAQIDAEKLRNDINEQNIAIYIAQVDAVKTSADAFKAEVEGIAEQVQVETLKIQNFKIEIDAYIAEIQGKTEEFKIYSEQIRGELAKVQIYDSQVRAYSSLIESFSRQSDVDLKEIDAEIEVEKLKIAKYESDIRAFISQVEADRSVFASAVDIYRGQAQIYVADVGFNTAQAEIKLKELDNTVVQNRSAADVGLKNIDVLLENARLTTSSRLEGLRAAAGVYSQVAASSLNAVTLGAQVQGSVGITLNESHNFDNI